MRPSPIGPSSRSGEFVLMIVMQLGSRASVSRSTPRARQVTSIASSTTVRPAPRHCQDLSSSVTNAPYMSRWRVATGRSVGSSGPPPSWWMTSRLPMQRTKSSMTSNVPARRPRSRSDENAGPPTAPKTRCVATEGQVPRRVPGVERELPRRQRDELLDLCPVEADRRAGPGPTSRAGAERTHRGPDRPGTRRRSPRGSAATPDGSPRPGRRSRPRAAGTGCAASARAGAVPRRRPAGAGDASPRGVARPTTARPARSAGGLGRGGPGCRVGGVEDLGKVRADRVGAGRVGASRSELATSGAGAPSAR